MTPGPTHEGMSVLHPSIGAVGGFPVSGIGQTMHNWAGDLWPLPRSLTGVGVRATFSYLQDLLPGLMITEVPSGSQAMDWRVPPEWHVRDAYIIGPDGRRFADWRVNNLHLVGYSMAVDVILSRQDLEPHLYSIEALPHAIPYVTSYYEKRWGFCLSHHERSKLPEGEYRIVVDADHFDGHLTYADFVIPGVSEQEVFFSTYVCHPSMANNELSGIVVAAGVDQVIRPGLIRFRIVQQQRLLNGSWQGEKPFTPIDLPSFQRLSALCAI